MGEKVTQLKDAKPAATGRGSARVFSEAELTVMEPPRQLAPASAPSPAPVVQGIDLSGKPKIVMAAGRGRTGKTTFLRWAAERALREGKSPYMADLDPTNASFASYFDGVARPRNLAAFIEHVIGQNASAIIDLGGGDATLPALVAEMPEIHDVIEESGYGLAMFYLTGPTPDDLAPMLNLSAQGFLPSSRAIVFNEWLAPAGTSREVAYARVLRSADYQAQIAAGTIPVWMPKLHAADRVEALRCEFGEAREGRSAATGESLQIGLVDRTRVHSWLRLMDQQFEGVKTWLP